MTTEEAILKQLTDAVLNCAPKDAKVAAELALKEGIDPVVAINKGLIEGMGIIGEKYEERKMYLPQVLVAAHAMYEGLDVLIPAIPKEGLKDSKTGVVAVVQGDVHDIGKNIVKTMMTASGIIVTDLGNDVPQENVINALKEKHTNVVALSTLMTPTMESMENTIKLICDNGCRDGLIITIGGPPTSDKFAKEIGADHRDESAQHCVNWLKEQFEEGN